jgi:protein TonB
MLIGTAAFVTTATASMNEAEEKPQQLVYVRASAPVSASPIFRQTSPRTQLTPQVPRAVSVSFEIPTSLPALSAALAISGPADFPTTTGNPAVGTDTVGPPAANARHAYDVHEVERAASALPGNMGPEYPSALRAAGVEGEVVAQFVVSTKGRAEPGSIRVVSATNELFSAAVKRALPRMRFAPALIGRKPVPQFVQQLFVFKLDR